MGDVDIRIILSDAVSSSSSFFDIFLLETLIFGEKVAPLISSPALSSSHAMRSSLCFSAAAIILSTTALAAAL
jgi:hypothetical protein